MANIDQNNKNQWWQQTANDEGNVWRTVRINTSKSFTWVKGVRRRLHSPQQSQSDDRQSHDNIWIPVVAHRRIDILNYSRPAS